MSIKSLSTIAAAALALCAFGAHAATTNGFANGSFETAGVATPADAWLQAAAGYTRSSDAHSGSFSAQLSSPAFNAAVMLQNSIEQGGLPALTVGDVPMLSFWSKGYAGDTGNVLFALRYLDGSGNILANGGNQFFQSKINPNTWTQITYTLAGGVPAGATAAFIEFSQGIGPVGFDPASGNTLAGGTVLVDDLYLGVVSVPEPGTYAMLLAGLAGMGLMARRRRSV
jgi:hypothetical protein